MEVCSLIAAKYGKLDSLKWLRDNGSFMGKCSLITRQGWTPSYFGMVEREMDAYAYVVAVNCVVLLQLVVSWWTSRRPQMDDTEWM